MSKEACGASGHHKAKIQVTPLLRLGARISMSSDPVLTLLGRYQAELEAFEPPLDCLRVAQNTWVSTRDKIIHSRPAATTAIGALAALQHVVQCKDLFDESADLQMLWH